MHLLQGVSAVRPATSRARGASGAERAGGRDGRSHRALGVGGDGIDLEAGREHGRHRVIGRLASRAWTISDDAKLELHWTLYKLQIAPI